jgi:hypothetical protein
MLRLEVELLIQSLLKAEAVDNELLASVRALKTVFGEAKQAQRKNPHPMKAEAFESFRETMSGSRREMHPEASKTRLTRSPGPTGRGTACLYRPHREIRWRNDCR